ncbi:MAG: Asp-tRNA(Asn)/Glu-tRNA(Gln) amidotransferase subunit GatC [Candidatus Pacebacteria bacterium]|nr:Asp-tRNA(Asn)/Glu-tRNA(Gln) amidotransferase subunit GatC [Candidatus Paceibacterota bacterium]
MSSKLKKLNQKQVRRVADLAKLTLTAKEIAKFTAQLSTILDHFQSLAEVNTAEVESTSQVTGLRNVTRQDGKPGRCLASAEALADAPAKHQGYFKVKGIFEKK